MHSRCAIGIDIGGTKAEVALVREDGYILKTERFDTNDSMSADEIVVKIVEIVGSLLSSSNPLAVGVGVAGQIDRTTGTVIFAPNLNWHDVPLQKKISEALQLPTVVSNDGRMGTWGEWKLGAGKGAKDLVCIFVGTGIGGGIISNNCVLEGYSNTAGEIGHCIIDFRGPSCTCGSKGCVEAYAGGWGIVERFQQLTNAKISSKEVFEESLKGNLKAIKVINEAIEALAALSISLIHAFNPEKLIFGGGVIEAQPQLVELIEKKVCQQALTAAKKELVIRKGELKGKAIVIGAASRAFIEAIKGENHG